MPSASVGINLSGIIDYFRKGKELETFKQIRPQVYEKMRTALKAGDTDAADQAIFEGRMQFLQSGGSDEAADTLFRHMDQALVEKKKRNLLDQQMLMQSGNYEAVGEPGNVKLQKRRGLMEQVMGGGQPTTGTAPTAVQQGGTLLPSLSSPTATASMPPMKTGQSSGSLLPSLSSPTTTAPMPPMPVRPPLQEQNLGGTEQPVSSVEGSTQQPAQWDTSTVAGRNQIKQKVAPFLMSGDKRTQEEAKRIYDAMSDLNKQEKSTRKRSTPQMGYNKKTGQLQPFSLITNEETDETTSTVPLEDISLVDPKKKTISQGPMLRKKNGQLVQEVTETDPWGNPTKRYDKKPSALDLAGAKPELWEQAYESFLSNGGKDTPAARAMFKEKAGPVADVQRKELTRQIAGLERKKSVLEKKNEVTSYLQNGPQNSSIEEKRAGAEYDKLQDQIDQLNTKLADLNTWMKFTQSPTSSVAPASQPLAPTSGAAAQSPGMVPLSSPPPRTPAAPARNWVQQGLRNLGN